MIVGIAIAMPNRQETRDSPVTPRRAERPHASSETHANRTG
ncbi:hypothetical protein GEM_2085 [Burkholderia cepacia GG4]|uniref:Uncharacterized protein n=1 Tax=Burkholderia cepacia GG4 TaxID=1009846 RepID=A0A9W3K4E1_BURCE|nr:hypothetical protein GEM_2085 [Burkholderia cepacia GG4]